LVAASEGGEAVPRAAFPVVSMPSFRAEARSRIQLFRMPSSIRARRELAMPQKVP
jgi:hypothetical protein